MQLIASDSEYNALVMLLDRECAESLRRDSRDLRLGSAELIAISRRLRRQFAQVLRTAHVLRARSEQVFAA